MKDWLKNCALTGAFGDPRVAESALSLIAELRQRRINVLVAAEEAQLPPGTDCTVLPRTSMLAQAELLVSIGGDGTLLQAARAAADSNLPVLGINRGRLGFLTDVLPQEIGATVDALVTGNCTLDRRALLKAQVQRADGQTMEQLALNDVVLLRRETGRLLDFETRVSGRYINSHSGDGFVVATATGSTAYALSCGGPIVDPQLNMLVMVPICPHTLSDRPLVVSGDSAIEISLQEQGQVRADVSCDGVPLGEMAPGDRLLIGASGRAVTLLHPPGYDYFRLLRSKLRWGRGSEQHER